MKLKYLIASLGFLIVVAPALNAQDAGKNHAGAKEKQARMLAKFDANHNGILDPDEQAALDKFKAGKIAKFDKNGDGKLDKTEREAMRADHKANGKHKGACPATTGTEATPKP